MSPHLATTSWNASEVIATAAPHSQRALYLLAALACLMVALRSAKRAIAPFGAIVQAAAAVALVALAVGAAVILIVAFLLDGR